MRYSSCAPAILYRAGGFYDPAELLARLRDPLQTPQDRCRVFQELFPPFQYVRPPAALYTEDEAFARTLDEHQRHYNETSHLGAATALVCLTSALVNQNVVYVRSATAVNTIYETHRPNDRPYVPEIDPLASPYPIERVQKAGTVDLFIGSAGSGNYGHWLVDDLPRARAIEILQESAVCRTVRIWLTAATPSIDHVRTESLKRLCQGLRQVQVRLLRPNRTYEFPELYYVTPVSYHPLLKSPDALEFVRRRVGYPPRVADRRIFVTRRANHIRGIANAEEVEALLQQRGFRVVDVEAMSFVEQVDTFAGAAIVIGGMGAAMTNTVFCPKGAAIVYLAPKGWMEPFYWDLAAVVEHRYYACYGPVTDLTVAPHLSGYRVDTAMLQRALDDALRS